MGFVVLSRGSGCLEGVGVEITNGCTICHLVKPDSIN